jgi:DNA repair exonuclease SbcCD ATPase subunit
MPTKGLNMKPMIHCAVLCAFTLSACAARRQAEPTVPATPQAQSSAKPQAAATPARAAIPATRPTGAWYSERVVRVTHGGDEDVFDAVVQQLHSPEVIGQIVQSCGLPADATKYVAVELQDRGNRADVKISVDLSRAPAGTPLAAREVADALVARLKDALRDESQGTAPQERAELERAMADAQKHLQESQLQLQALRQRVRQQTGRADASADAVRQELAKMEEQRQEFQLESEAKAARMAALTENIAKLTKEVDEKVKNDAVAAELEKVVEARQQRVERIKQMVQVGQATAAELDEAMANVAEARARLLDRHGEAAERAGAGTAQEWNRELMAISVDTAELKARLDKLTERLDKFQSVADEVDQLDTQRQAREQAQQAMDQVKEQLAELKRQQQQIRGVRALVVHSEDRAGDRPGESKTGSTRTDIRNVNSKDEDR